ncbi:MAG: hypothetical protein ACFB2Z_15210 [Maricaulaceae bacterium]
MHSVKERVLGRQLADELTAAELDAVSGGGGVGGGTGGDVTLTKAANEGDNGLTFVNGSSETEIDDPGFFG